jgi:hypothetical protein
MASAIKISASFPINLCFLPRTNGQVPFYAMTMPDSKPPKERLFALLLAFQILLAIYSIMIIFYLPGPGF